MLVYMDMKICIMCGEKEQAPRGKMPYCLDCHAFYMREYRKAHALEEQKRRRKYYVSRLENDRPKKNARSLANNALRFGNIQRQPCEKCGEWAQMHHPDYSQPLIVVWLCKKHHIEHHNKL